MKPIQFLLLALLFASCSQTNQSESSHPPASDSSTQQPVTVPLYASRKAHPFSRADKADTFQLAIRGESLLTGQAYFQITDYTGKSIYSVNFPANQLIDYPLTGIVDPVKEEQYVKQRVDSFFRPDKFIDPAPAKSTGEAGPATIRFSYRVGKTDSIRIVYDKTLNKVVRD